MSLGERPRWTPIVTDMAVSRLGKPPSHPDPDRSRDIARTLPDGWEALEAAGAAPYEIATLRRLAAELPDDHAVFHGVHWTRLDRGYSVFGEVDFIVVGPRGQAVLIEQKNRALEETPDGLVKHYAGKTALVGTAGSGNMQLTPRIREDAAVKGRRQS